MRWYEIAWARGKPSKQINVPTKGRNETSPDKRDGWDKFRQKGWTEPIILSLGWNSVCLVYNRQKIKLHEVKTDNVKIGDLL